jgi:hypothetical protein
MYTLCGYPRCGAWARLGQSYCETHARAAEKARHHAESIRQQERFITESWRRIYYTDEWALCKRIVRQRDGNQCTWVENGERCDVRGNHRKPSFGKRLQVHHRVPMTELWRRAGQNWDSFLPMATNPDICALLCSHHHTLAENELRTLEPVRYARPRTRPSDRRRRRR